MARGFGAKESVSIGSAAGSKPTALSMRGLGNVLAGMTEADAIDSTTWYPGYNKFVFNGYDPRVHGTFVKFLEKRVQWFKDREDAKYHASRHHTEWAQRDLDEYKKSKALFEDVLKKRGKEVNEANMDALIKEMGNKVFQGEYGHNRSLLASLLGKELGVNVNSDILRYFLPNSVNEVNYKGNPKLIDKSLALNKKVALEKLAERNKEARDEAVRKVAEQKQAKKDAVLEKRAAKVDKKVDKLDALREKLGKKFLKDGSVRKGQENAIRELKAKIGEQAKKVMESIPPAHMEKIRAAVPEYIRDVIESNRILTNRSFNRPDSWEMEDYENGRSDAGYKNLGELRDAAMTERDRVQKGSAIVESNGKKYEVSWEDGSYKIGYDPKQFAIYTGVTIKLAGKGDGIVFGQGNVEGG